MPIPIFIRVRIPERIKLFLPESFYVRGALYALVVQTFGASALIVLMLAPCPADFNALARLNDVLA